MKIRTPLLSGHLIFLGPQKKFGGSGFSILKGDLCIKGTISGPNPTSEIRNNSINFSNKSVIERFYSRHIQ